MATTQTMTVYTALKAKIQGGGFSPAESLPETDLAAQYEVSRNTIKKALLMLEKEGMVTIEPNKGAKVRAYSKREVIEFLEVREAMEGFLASVTAPVITEQNLTRMDSLMIEMERLRAARDLLAYSQCNGAFHQIIYDACPNRTAAEFIINLKNQMRKYNSKTILIPGRDECSFAEHKAILAAFRARDSVAAEKVMRLHISGVRKVFDDNFDLLF